MVRDAGGGFGASPDMFPRRRRLPQTAFPADDDVRWFAPFAPVRVDGGRPKRERRCVGSGEEPRATKRQRLSVELEGAQVRGRG